MKKKFKHVMTLSSAALTVISAVPMSLVVSAVDTYAKETTEIKIQTNSNEKKQPTYRNVMYYGDWSIYDGREIIFQRICQLINIPTSILRLLIWIAMVICFYRIKMPHLLQGLLWS